MKLGRPAAQVRSHGASAALAGLKSLLRPTFLPNHYPALHGLRVLAIVLVVQLHATAALNEVHIVDFSTLNLWFGMDLFFFLSGFLIGSMLLVEPAAGRRVNIYRFYVRRTFRIVPAYVLILSLLVWLYPPSATIRANLWKEYVYLTNYVPPNPGNVMMPWAWSLALEEHFYLCVPLLVLALRALPSVRAQLYALIGLWFSALGFRVLEYVAHGPWDYMRALSILYVRTHLRYDILVAGIFVACLQHYYTRELRIAMQRGSVRLGLLALSMTGFSLLIFTWKLQTTWLQYNLLCWGTLTSVAYAPLVLWLINHEGAVSRLLSLSFFRYFATFGYGLYLLHVPVVYVVCLPIVHNVQQHFHMPWQVAWLSMVVASLGVSAACGYLVHILIEKPSLKLRDILSP
ncbi:MAG: hypothetical protein RL701_3021 [Pseudomonadota bacterium]|jgi:peptidoglycan/LPS O-acetylase OafA/YrhL